MASGDILKALDEPPGAYDPEAADETAWTNTSFASGTNVNGVVFTAPTSGNVMVFYRARVQANSANQRALVSVKVSTGSTIDAGVVVSPAADDQAIETSQGTTGGAETRMQCGDWRYVTGLTAGNAYNAVVQFKVFGGTGSIFQREVYVLPCP